MKKLLLIVGLVLSLSKLWAVIIAPGSTFPIVTDLRLYPGLRLLGVATNGNMSSDPNTRSNFTMSIESMDAYFGANATNYTVQTVNSASNILASLGSGFQFLITTNMSTTQIQAVLNSMTNGGTVSIQQGRYNITAALRITNSMLVSGNGASFVYADGLTNYMFDTGTNYRKSLIVQDLIFDGHTYASFNNGTMFAGGGGADFRPYSNPYWTNRTGMRAECSGGVVVRGCSFFGWSGNGLLLLNILGSTADSGNRAFVINNRFATNFIGVYAPENNYEIPGYYHSDSSLWNDIEPEYSQIIDNQVFNNTYGIIPGAGNCTVLGNIANANYSAISLFGGVNDGHGNYSFNNLNHCTWGLFYQGIGGGGLGGDFVENQMYFSSALFFNGVANINFTLNHLKNSSLIFTNGCIGNVSDNVYNNTNWGLDLPTNFGPGIRVFGNISTIATNTDGSASSMTTISSNSPFAGSYAFTPDGTNWGWANPPSATIGPSVTTNLVVWTNQPTFTVGQLLVITGTNANGSLVVTPTNSISGTKITSGTLPFTAADSTWYSLTNVVGWTNQPTFTVGQALVITGTNAQGVLMVKATNFPSGTPQTPWAQNIDAAFFNLLDLNTTYWTNTTTLNSSIGALNTASGSDDGSILSFIGRTNNASATASLLADRLIAQQQVRVNGGSISLIPTNASPIQLYTNSPGSLPMGITNVASGRGQPVIQYYVIDAVTGTPILTVSNEQTGVKMRISNGALAFVETNFTTLPITTTNSVWRLRDESAGTGASVGILTNWIIGL